MSSQINPRGAVDLSALAAARKAEAESAQARATAPAGVILDVGETTFEVEVIHRSSQVPVIVDFWAEWCGPCKQLSPILEKLTAEQGGKIVLAKIDSDREQRLASAFQVQSIPSVFLVINGQVQPLFQGAVPEAQLRQLFEQVLKVAEQAGLGAIGAETEGETAPEPVDPRYERAYEAIEKADWDGAEAAFSELVAANPADEDAKAGLLQVALMRRTDGIDPIAVAAAPLTSVADRLASADALLLLAQPAAACDRLLEGVASAGGEERNLLKDRLLEFFTIIGDSPEVREARRRLTNLLF